MPPKPSTQPARIVAVALDDKMVYAFFVLVHSLRATASEDFHLLVGYFPGKLSHHNKSIITRFMELGEMSWEMRELAAHPLFTERRHLTITTFSKFVISDALPGAHLWVDLDTVARPGWDDIFEHMEAAAPGIALVVATMLESPYTRFDGFNAGVLGWTREPRQEWAPVLATLPEKRFSSEQYLFNELYSDKHQSVDYRFNFLSSWHDQVEKQDRASIIHYSGPIKPWHLNRRHAAPWDAINGSWKYWYAAEQDLMHHWQSTELARPLQGLARRAVFSGRLHLGKGALAGLFMRALGVLGPLGTPLVMLVSSRRRR